MFGSGGAPLKSSFQGTRDTGGALEDKARALEATLRDELLAPDGPRLFDEVRGWSGEVSQLFTNGCPHFASVLTSSVQPFS